MVAVVADMLFGAVFGFWSTENFALYACDISKILSNVEKPKKPTYCKSDRFHVSNMAKKPLILYCILFASN